MGNPFIWWMGLAALCFAIWRFIVHKDRLGIVLAVGTFASWLPWIPFAHRTIFTFYSVTMAPFVVMTLVFASPALRATDCSGGAILATTSAGRRVVPCGRRSSCRRSSIPVWTGQSIPQWYRDVHVWLPTW